MPHALRAETFAGNPAVLGYDLLNEPYGDEVTEIAPLYEDIAVRIRKHDSSAILFVQPQARSLAVAHSLCMHGVGYQRAGQFRTAASGCNPCWSCRGF
jgi:hypothetical protein